MRKQKPSAKTSIRRGTKIRHYIYNLILKNPSSSLKIPSAPQLAKMFGIARSTVALELKELVAEGVITGHRGIGTFTNPKAVPGLLHIPEHKVVGIIFENGANLFFDYYGWALQSYAGMELIPNIAHPRGIALEGGTNEAKFDEIMQYRVDGLIWISPPERLRPLLLRLKDSGMPLITCDLCVEGIPGAGIDYDCSGAEIAEILIKKKRTKILWHNANDRVSIRLNAIKRIFTEKNIDLDGLTIVENSFHWLEDMEKIISTSPPDVIYAHGENVFAILEILKKHGIDSQKCSVIASWHDIRRIDNFKGIIHKLPLKQIGVCLAEMMDEAMNGSKENTEYKLIKEQFEEKI